MVWPQMRFRFAHVKQGGRSAPLRLLLSVGLLGILAFPYLSYNVPKALLVYADMTGNDPCMMSSFWQPHESVYGCGHPVMQRLRYEWAPTENGLCVSHRSSELSESEQKKVLGISKAYKTLRAKKHQRGKALIAELARIESMYVPASDDQNLLAWQQAHPESDSDPEPLTPGMRALSEQLRDSFQSQFSAYADVR
jgi:hypothetical protein